MFKKPKGKPVKKKPVKKMPVMPIGRKAHYSSAPGMRG